MIANNLPYVVAIVVIAWLVLQRTDVFAPREAFPESDNCPFCHRDLAKISSSHS